ncbi:MAG: hypothetical protein U0Q19_06775 [Kineosporiaceae bacterium]
MKLRTRMNAAVGAGVLTALSLTAWGLSSAQAAPVTGAAASATLAHRMISVHEPKGRGGDGHGGEHSGGSSHDDHESHGSKGRKSDNRHDNHGDHHGGGDHHGDGGGNHGGGDHDGDGGHGCHYPPSRSHQVVLHGPSRGHGHGFTLTGKVTHNGCGVPDAKVGLYTSRDGSTGWVLVGKTKVGKDGSFAFNVSNKGRHYYQTVVAPDKGHDPAASGIVSTRHR